MGLLSWIILGLIVGLIASGLMREWGYGPIGDVVVGILGAFLGGWLATEFLGIDPTGLSFTSIAIGMVGAVVLIFVSRRLMPARRAPLLRYR
jgi:uncharacterized membrane protein YeaQ/YmgE (transglycosylase-associated protein family)